MGKVIDLSERQPHMQGLAVCLACKHEWQGVSPIGVCDLECPECGLMKGVYYSNCLPDDKPIWTCNCGCHHFVLLESYFMCVHCGLGQVFEFED